LAEHKPAFHKFDRSVGKLGCTQYYYKPLEGKVKQ
jgi:hypothetical protein